MGANGHRKGARWERAVAAYLRDHGFPDAERVGNTGHHDDRGLDIAGVAPWGIDAKDREEWRIPSWWRTCVQRCEEQGRLPVVIVKRPRKPVGAALVLCEPPPIVVYRPPSLDRHVSGHGARLAAAIDDGPVVTDLGLVACTLADWCREVGS